MIFAAALAAAAVVVPLAVADAPTVISPTPVDQFQPSPGVCYLGKPDSFPIELDVLANDEMTRIFSNGTVIVTGKFTVRVTNLTTGKSIVVQANGPEFGSTTADGGIFIPTLSGSSVIGPIPLTEGGGIFLTHGPTDVTGYFTTTSAGKKDLCAVLAAL